MHTLSFPPILQTNTNLIRQGDDGSLSGDIGDPAVKVFTAGSQDRAVGPETPVFYHHGHITQNILLPLIIQTLENMGTVHCRLKGEHRRARSLERHGSNSSTCVTEGSQKASWSYTPFVKMYQFVFQLQWLVNGQSVCSQTTNLQQFYLIGLINLIIHRYDM